MTNLEIAKMIQLATEANKKGDYAQTELLCNEMLLLCPFQPNDGSHSNEANEFHLAARAKLFDAYRSQDLYPKAFEVVSESVRLAKQQPNKNILSNTLRHLGVLHHLTSNFKLASEALNEALAISISCNDTRQLGLVNMELGTLSIHAANYSKAIQHYQVAKQIAQKVNDTTQQAKCWNNIGNVYMYMGDFANAIQSYSTAIDMYHATGNQREIAEVYGNVGGAYTNLHDYPQALFYLEKATAINSALGHKIGLALQHAIMGNVYSQSKDYAKAIELYSRVIDTLNPLNDKVYLGSLYNSMASTYILMDEFDNALSCCEKALAIAREKNNTSNEAAAKCTMGDIYRSKKFSGYNPQKAEAFLQKALELSTAVDSKSRLQKCHQVLAELYESEKRYSESLFHFKAYHTLHEQMQSEAATQAGQQMEHRRKLEDAERDRQVKLARLHEQEKILLNILPTQIAERILDGEKQIADSCENVSVFFCDIVGFTQLSQTISAEELVTVLNEIFSAFDKITKEHGLEKIKTIGDAYMAVAGVPLPQENHAERAAYFALEVMQWMKDYRQKTDSDLHIRVGLHCGHAVAGVIGENKYAYDLWGDAVNTASRMESHGVENKIQVSDVFKNLLTEKFTFEERGEIELKGKGKMKTWFLLAVIP